MDPWVEIREALGPWALGLKDEGPRGFGLERKGALGPWALELYTRGPWYGDAAALSHPWFILCGAMQT